MPVHALAAATGSGRGKAEVTLELLLALSVPPPVGPDAQKVSELCQVMPPQWGSLLTLAERHGLIPLLYDNLENMPTAAACAGVAVMESLRQRAATILKHNLFLAGELARLVALLEAGGVAVLPLKGPLLALRAYGSLKLRRFKDLDLLIRPRDYGRALALLAGEGYSPLGPSGRALGGGESRLVNPGGLFCLELHQRLAPPHWAVSLERRLWRRSAPVEFDIGCCRRPAVEDELLYLAFHAGKHGWARLAWSADLAALLAVESGLDWQLLWHNAGRLGLRRILAVSLLIAHDCFAAPLPAAQERLIIGDSRACRIAARWRRRLLLPEADACHSGLRSFASSRERCRDRARIYCLGAFVPSEADYAWLTLPLALTPLYCCLRPARLLAKYGRQVLRPTKQ